MGKFDLDDLLEDLGRTPSGQPLEPPTPDEPAAEDDAFVRNDPNETPRPPDISGEGLGNANTQIAPHNADPTRVKPDDALTAIYKPDAQDVPEGTDHVTYMAHAAAARVASPEWSKEDIFVV